MKIHEYQAKAVLARFNVPIPRGEVAFTPEEAHDISKRLGGPIYWRTPSKKADYCQNCHDDFVNGMGGVPDEQKAF